MATVKFDVPDAVKASFERAFVRQDRNAIIAELMRRAVRQTAQPNDLHERRETLFSKLTDARARRPVLTSEELQKVRALGRQ